jgi:ABC-type multidrug transport system permease subunit
MFGALNSFPAERGVVNRDRSSKMYHVLPYYLARFICDIPLRVGQGCLFGIIVYWIVGLNPSAAAFFIFVCLLIVEGLAAQGLGVAVSAGAKNEKVALAIAPAITVILILFGGFYVNEATIPVWLRWIKYLSHLYWGFMGLTINNFAGRSGWKCPPVAIELNPNCELEGDEIVRQFGFDPSQLWLAFVGMLALIFAFNGLGYLMLRRSKPKYLPLSTAAAKKTK